MFLLQTGQLNEYTERKEMSCSVICMALGRVPAGEQRSRFLAVGLSDNTIRIISLQPQVCSRHHSFKHLLALKLPNYVTVCLPSFSKFVWWHDSLKTHLFTTAFC